MATWPGPAIRHLEMLSSGAASRDSQISNSAPKSQRLEMWVIESLTGRLRIVSEGDLIGRAEIDTERQRLSRLELLY